MVRWTRGRDTDPASAASAGLQVERRALAERAHRRAQVGHELLRLLARLGDVLVGLPLGEMARHFELERERGDGVAEAVVQLARNAQPLADARRFGEERLGGRELGVHPRQLLAGARFAHREARRAQREQLEGAEDEAVQRGAQEGAAGEEHGDEHRRLGGHPGERGAAANEERQLAGDDHEEPPTTFPRRSRPPIRKRS